MTARTASNGDRTMCFADPAKVFSIDGSTARVMTDDGLQDVSLRLVEAAGDVVRPGDWVLVALGLIVSVVDDDDAQILFNRRTAIRGSTN